MAVITAYLLPVALNTNSAAISADISANAFTPAPVFYQLDTDAVLKGVVQNNLPITVVPLALSASKLPTYYDDYYNRIHINPNVLALGNIVSTQSQSINVWNAYLTSVTLLQIDGIEDGLAVTGAEYPPVNFAALQEKSWDVSVTPDGPFVLDATVSWVFNNDDVAALQITGNRISAFSWIVDWAKGVKESLTWATSIVRSRTGVEQRRALRLSPRRELEVDLLVAGRERQALDIILYGWGSRVFAVPYMPDIQTLATAVTAGDFVIPCDTQYLDFRVGGLAMLIGDDAFSYETVEIDSIQSNQITLARELINSWPVGTRLYPARTARLLQNPQLNRLTDSAQRANLQFSLAETSDLTGVMPATIYRGYPVFDALPDESSDLTAQFQNLLLSLDSGMALPQITDTADQAFPTQLHRWFLFGRAERYAFKQLMYALNGKQKAVWVPTHADDLTLVAVVTDTATTLDIANIQYARFGQQKPFRRDIRIQLKNGTVFRRRITGSQELNAATERLQIDTALGQLVNPSDVERISWLQLMRADSDSVELVHETDSLGFAHAQQVFRGVLDDEF